MLPTYHWHGWRRLLPGGLPGRTATLFWGVAIAAAFAWHVRWLTNPTFDFLRSGALGSLLVYSALFVGFRTGSRLPGTPLATVDPLARTAIELALGLTVLIAAMLVLGVCGLYRPEVVAGMGIVLLVGSHPAFWRSLRQRFRVRGRRRGAEPIAWTCLLLVGAMTLLESLAPATSQDALVYHLAIPAAYVREGGIHYIEGNFFAQFPQNVEMLFTLGLLLGGESLACWFNMLQGAGAALAVAALARTVRRGASAEIAAAAFVTIPTAALIAGWAYVDLGVTFFAICSTLSFLVWTERRESRTLLVLAAVFAGVTAGCKYTGGLQGILLCSAVALVLLRDGRGLGHALRLAAVTALVVGLVASPWWIKNAILTGNPLFPFAYDLLGGRDWDSERAALLSEALSQWGGERGLLATLLLPWRLTMSGKFFSIEQFDGVIGAIFLMTLPLLPRVLATSRRARIVFLFLLGEVLCWTFMTWQVRFLLPGLGLLSAIIAIHPLWRTAGWYGASWRGLARAALLFNTLLVALHFAAHNPAAVVLGLESRDAYLQREIPGGDYEVFRFIEAELPQESRVLFGSLGNPGFLCKRPYRADAFFENYTIAEMLREASSATELLRAFRERGFTHFLFRWENVFDPSNRKSEIPPPDQAALARFLNLYGRLRAQQAGTFLYEIVDEPRDLSAPEPRGAAEGR